MIPHPIKPAICSDVPSRCFCPATSRNNYLKVSGNATKSESVANCAERAGEWRPSARVIQRYCQRSEQFQSTKRLLQKAAIIRCCSVEVTQVGASSH